jgi:hypothetical protein
MTAGCPITYKIFYSSSVHDVPAGIDVTNPLNSGTPYLVPVLDAENPMQYKMVIQAESENGILLYSPTLTLTVKCPKSIEFNVPSYLTYMTSYVGANTVGTGSGASFSFSAISSKLPKCTQILGYEIIEQSPAGKITYPSAKFCQFSDPCLSLDFDVSEVQVITFKVKPIDS